MTLDYPNLRKLDLNLLLALDVLIEEANVTKAADKLGMSQSAMSYSLKRLRALLDDPILVRTSRKMEATPYAHNLSVVVRRILNDIQASLLEQRKFNPKTSREIIRIALSDHIEISLGQRLLEKLMQQAPAMSIRVRYFEHSTLLDALDDDKIDLLVDTDVHPKSWHLKQELYREELVCVANGNCDVSEMSLEEYLTRCHLVSFQDSDVQKVEDGAIGLSRPVLNVVWSTPHVIAILYLIVSCNYVALLPKRLAQYFAPLLGLQVLASPIDVECLTISMCWHQRNDNVPHHQWFRDRVIEVAQVL